jgi:hypothetical protein
MPFSLNMPIMATDMLKPKVRFVFEPFKDTMEVSTFYNIFKVNETVYNNLLMPKGIGSIDPLPIDFVTIYYQTKDSWQKGY